jgi:glucose-1-phosphate adenylyltransferase
LGPRVRINSYATVENSILFDDVFVGRYAKIRRAIIEKGVCIPEGTIIGDDLDRERQRGFTVTPGGVVVIPRLDRLDEVFARNG